MAGWGRRSESARADEAARRAEQERSKQKAAPKPGRRISLVRDKAKTSAAPADAETPEQRDAALAALPPKVRENIERPLTREEREAAGEDTRREGSESDANMESDFFEALDRPEPGSSVFNALAQYVFNARSGTNGANLTLEGMLAFVRHPRVLASVIPVLAAMEDDARGLPSGRVGKFAQAFRTKWQDATGTRWGSPEAERVCALLPGGGRPSSLSEGKFFGVGQIAAAANAAGMSDAEMFDRVLARVLAPNGLRLDYDPASDKAAQQRLAAQRARNPFASNRSAVSEAEQARQASDESMDAEREAERSLGLGPEEEETSNRYDLGDMDDGAMYSDSRTAALANLPEATRAAVGAIRHVLPNVRFRAVRDEAELRRAAGGSVEESLRASRVTLADGTVLPYVSDIDDARRLAKASPDDVKAYLLGHMEDNLPLLAGGTARIDATSAHHFAWSPYNLVPVARSLHKARGKAATAIKDILAVVRADSSTQEQNKDLASSEQVWRCRAPFAIPSFANDGSVVGVNVYDGDVIVKDAGDGKFFYDLTQLKKNAALPLRRTVSWTCSSRRLKAPRKTRTLRCKRDVAVVSHNPPPASTEIFADPSAASSA